MDWIINKIGDFYFIYFVFIESFYTFLCIRFRLPFLQKYYLVAWLTNPNLCKLNMVHCCWKWNLNEEILYWKYYLYELKIIMDFLFSRDLNILIFNNHMDLWKFYWIILDCWKAFNSKKFNRKIIENTFMVKGCERIKGSIEWGRSKRKAPFPVFRLGKQAIKDCFWYQRYIK